MRAAMRGSVVAIACVLVAQSGCFAVEPVGPCVDSTGLFEAGQVCLVPGLDLALPGAPWQLRRAVFDKDGVDDLAVGLASGDGRTVYAATELAGAGKLTQVASPAVIQDFVPSFVYGDPTGVQDLATLIETGDLIKGGKLAVHTCGDDVFASGERASFDLRGMAFGLPCIRPVSLAAVGDGIMADIGWGVACDSMPAPDKSPVEPADIGFFLSPAIDKSGSFEAYGDPRYSSTHAVVAARLNDGAFQDIGFAAVPSSGNSDVIALTYDNDDVARPSESVVMPGQGLISRLYAADLDGDGVEEFVALHRKGDVITISRRTQKDPPTYAPLDQELYAGIFAVPSPLAAAFGDFTGDGEVDIAVAFDNEDGTTSVGVYIRWPDQDPGVFFSSLGALRTYTDGEAVVDLMALTLDDDDKPDLAVALATASGGRLQVFLNRSPSSG